MKLILEGLPQDLFQVRLLNQDGKEIEGGRQGTEISMVLEFAQAADKVQFIELNYAGGAERGAALDVTFATEVNGRR